MVQNEVIIDEELCHGCGYCVQFCPRGCLDIPGEQAGPMYSGYEIAKFVNPERCNACGICTRMCPCGAIEVYLSIKDPTKVIIRERVAGIPRLLSSVGFGDCVGCQKATVGRMITDVLDELGLGGKFIGLDAVRCNSSSAFGRDFNITIEREDKAVSLHGVHTDGISAIDLYDDPIRMALELKQTRSDTLVFVVQDTTKLDAIGIDSFDNGVMRGGNITIINCNELVYRGDPSKGPIAPPASPVNNPERRNLIMGKDPLHLAERAATFSGVNYSARGAIAFPDDYERTKSYIRTAFEKQTTKTGTSFVEVLCACFAQAYESPWDTLKWIHEKVVTELPLVEFKNIGRPSGV
jgi:NAD-dependent dihydropyrimidine dehydrogenase PreA subunit